MKICIFVKGLLFESAFELKILGGLFQILFLVIIAENFGILFLFINFSWKKKKEKRNREENIMRDISIMNFFAK